MPPSECQRSCFVWLRWPGHHDAVTSARSQNRKKLHRAGSFDSNRFSDHFGEPLNHLNSTRQTQPQFSTQTGDLKFGRHSLANEASQLWLFFCRFLVLLHRFFSSILLSCFSFFCSCLSAFPISFPAFLTLASFHHTSRPVTCWRHDHTHNQLPCNQKTTPTFTCVSLRSLSPPARTL
jgi:hypothetical protein